MVSQASALKKIARLQTCEKKTRLKMAAHELLAKQSIKQSTLFNAQLLWNFFTLFSTQRFCKESIASSCCHS
jgi:hypothetical protein